MDWFGRFRKIVFEGEVWIIEKVKCVLNWCFNVVRVFYIRVWCIVWKNKKFVKLCRLYDFFVIYVGYERSGYCFFYILYEL